MPDSPIIARTPVLRRSQDYAFLRSEGLRHIERLGHELWTDFNIHDPGIAMMELFCYAITELGYRTGYDIRDLLTESVNGVSVSRGDFHRAQDILTCNPVSFDDLRKLLIDITGVRNAWVAVNQNFDYFLDRVRGELSLKSSAGFEKQRLNGLYDVYIEFEDFVVDGKRMARLGLTERQSVPLDFVQPNGQGIAFNVEHELTIEKVAFYADSSGFVDIELVDRDNAVLDGKRVTTGSPGSKRTVTLDFRVPPGQGYRLRAKGTPKLLRVKSAALPEPFPYSAEHLMYLVSGHSGAQASKDYYFFFDWNIQYAVPPVAGLRPVTRRLTMGPNHGETGGMVDAVGRGFDFVAARDMEIIGLDLYAEHPGEVTLTLTERQTGATVDYVATLAKDRNTVEPIGFDVAGGADYRLAVTSSSTAMKLWEATSVTYPFAHDNVIEVGRPYRDPATLQAGELAAPDVSVLFGLTLEHPSQPHPINITRDDVLTAARNRLHERRNLCQDFVEVCDLEVEEVALCADIEVSPDADVEEVLAEVFFRLGLHVSPAVKFYSLDDMLAKGKAAEEIFEGPLLDHGFIDDDEFKQITRRCEIRTSDVVQIIMDVDGVEAIKTISLLRFSDGEETIQADWQLPLRPDEGRAPRFAADVRSKVVFYRNELPIFANRGRVIQLLKDKKARELQTKLKGYRTDVPVPVGRDRDVERYYPVQNELPVNFMVGQIRVPRTGTDLRKAQSRQLKAYLLLFEQILANYLSQLSNVSELFSWRVDADATYFTQPVFEFVERELIYNVDGIIATLEETGAPAPSKPAIDADLDERHAWLEEHHRQALEHIIETPQLRIDRRNRFLDHLLARFSEDVTTYAALMKSMIGGEGLVELIDHKRAFLADYPMLSANRGAAYDYRFPEDPENVSGFKRRISRLLGIEHVALASLADAGVNIEEITPGNDDWRFVMREDPNDPSSPVVFESMTCEQPTAIEALLDSIIEHGSETDNYVGRELRWKCPGEPVEILGEVTANASVETVRERFARLREAEGLHVIEHILLRLRTNNEPPPNPTPENPFLSVQLNEPTECECVEVTDPYSFRLSVVLPAWPDRFRDVRFRRYVEETLRTEAPAHIFLKICWISHDQMRELEACLGAWRSALGKLAPSLGVCRKEVSPNPLTGEPPLPETRDRDTPYQESLANLIDKLEKMINVYPLATLYDCEEDADRTHDTKPPITLNNTNLGTS